MIFDFCCEVPTIQQIQNFKSTVYNKYMYMQVIHNKQTDVFKINYCQACSQPVYSGKTEGPFYLFCIFIFRNERNWMKKSARVSEKLVSLGLPGLQVATRLTVVMHKYRQS